MSKNQAEAYYNAIKDSCEEIRRKPEIDKKYFKMKKDIFGSKSGKHIIFYQQSSKTKIEILRILHERMDFKTGYKNNKHALTKNIRQLALVCYLKFYY